MTHKYKASPFHPMARLLGALFLAAAGGQAMAMTEYTCPPFGGTYDNVYGPVGAGTPAAHTSSYFCAYQDPNAGAADNVTNNDDADDMNTDVFVNNSDGTFPASSTGAFNITDWEFLSKQDETTLEEPVDIDLNVTGIGGRSGTWAFNPAVWNDYSDIAIVLKDGSPVGLNSDGTSSFNGGTWAAFYVNASDASGYWEFTPDSAEGALSHLSVYGVKDGNGNGNGGNGTVPLPATPLLMGAGLAALLARRRLRP